jgi:hypothetical protein
LLAETGDEFRYTVWPRRGTQVVRERSAKPLYVGSIPTRASIKSLYKIRACGILTLLCTRPVPRFLGFLRSRIVFPRFPQVGFELLLPRLGPPAIMLFRYSHGLMANRTDTFQSGRQPEGAQRQKYRESDARVRRESSQVQRASVTALASSL